MTIRLRTLGELALERDGDRLNGAVGQRTSLALLALLASAPGAVVSRDKLMAYLWPEADGEHARHSLNQTIYALRKVLGADALLAELGDVRLNADIVGSDVNEFHRSVRAGNWSDSVRCYGGPFLDGFHLRNSPEFERWCDEQRSRLAHQYVSALEVLANAAAANGSATACVDFSQRLLTSDPTNSAFALRLVRALAAAGQPAKAIAAARVHTALLREQLEAEPSVELVSFVETLLHAAVQAPGLSTGGAHIVAAPPTDGPPEPKQVAGESSRAATAVLLARPRGAVFLAAGVGLIGVLGIATWAAANRPRSDGTARAHFAMALGSRVRVRPDVMGVTVALSRDGNQFAYVGGDSSPRLYLRRLDEDRPHPIPGTELGRSPQFSPDDKWLTFITPTDELKKLPLSGGPVSVIADSVDTYSWADDAHIVLHRSGTTRNGLWLANSSGNAPPTPLTALDHARGETSHTWPHVLPDKNTVLFAIVTNGEMGAAQLAAAHLRDPRVVRLSIRGVNPRYTPNGFVIFGRLDGSVHAMPFEPATTRVAGDPVTVLDNVIVKPGGATEMTLAGNGTLIYVPDAVTDRQLLIIDRAGRTRAIAQQRQGYESPRFSPDGKRIAVEIHTSSGSDIWIQDLQSKTLNRLTHNSMSTWPEWTADGGRVMWWQKQNRENWWEAWDGRGGAALMAPGPPAVPAGSNGYYITDRDDQNQIDKISLDPSHAITPLIVRSKIVCCPKPSPDQRWLAFASVESGRFEVYVRPLDAPGGTIQVSADGGSEPVWGPTGRELFYRSGSYLLAATIVTAPEFSVVRRDTLFPDHFASQIGIRANYDVAPDGNHFVVVLASDGEQPPVVALGWLAELRERFAALHKQ